MRKMEKGMKKRLGTESQALSRSGSQGDKGKITYRSAKLESAKRWICWRWDVAKEENKGR
jgi:hypothetical protein